MRVNWWEYFGWDSWADASAVSCGGIKLHDHRDCMECKKPVPVQTCPFCGGERSCMYCYGCPDCRAD